MTDYEGARYRLGALGTARLWLNALWHAAQDAWDLLAWELKKRGRRLF